MRRNSSNARPPPSEYLPPLITTVKKEVFGKPADDKRRENTAFRTSGSYSDRFSAPQNGFKPPTFSGGVQNVPDNTSTTTTTVAGRHPATVQIDGHLPANVSGQRMPRAVDNSRPALRPEVGEELAQWKTRSKEEDEKRLREKEQELRILQVISLSVTITGVSAL